MANDKRILCMLAQGSYAPAPLEAPMMEVCDRMYSLADALDHLNEGAVFLNSEGQLIWHNRAFDKLLVENREGHLLVAAVIEFAADFYQDLNEPRGAVHASEESMVRDVTVGRLAPEAY